ncbi:MAG: zinc ribbon domain-containing protein [bacterium]
MAAFPGERLQAQRVSVNRPRFFCEHCHGEVNSSDKLCPHCGRFFGKVRCPQCGLTGPAERFTAGCPSCGYAGGRIEGRTEHARLEILPLEDVDPDSAGLTSPGTGRWIINLPLWLYVATAVILTLVIFRVLIWLAS